MKVLFYFCIFTEHSVYKSEYKGTIKAKSLIKTTLVSNWIKKQNQLWFASWKKKTRFKQSVQGQMLGNGHMIHDITWLSCSTMRRVRGSRVQTASCSSTQANDADESPRGIIFIPVFSNGKECLPLRENKTFLFLVTDPIATLFT